MIIIRETGADVAASALKFNVNRLRAAVRNTLREGRTALKGLITARYTAKSPLKLGMVKSRVSGLTGQIRVSGPRNSLRHFIYRPSTRPPHDPPGGIFVQVVRGQGDNLPHAFIGRGLIFERTGRGRLPIKKVDTLSLAGMAAAVSDKTMARMAERLGIELEAAL